MNFRIESRVFGSDISPCASTRLPTRETTRRPPDQSSVPSVRNTGSHAFCARTVPTPLGEAPAIATGLPRHTRGISDAGLVSQSIAFFATPGRLLLYSGV